MSILLEAVEQGRMFGVLILGMTSFISLAMLKHMFNDTKHAKDPVSEEMCQVRVKGVMSEIKHHKDMTKLLLKANGIECPLKED